MRSLFNRGIKPKPVKPMARKPVVEQASLATSFADDYITKSTQKEETRLERDQKKNSHKRADERKTCFTVAEISLLDSGMLYDGVVTDASRNGVTFRPASHYIQRRVGDTIQLTSGKISKKGIIRSTRPDGYGIQLLEALSPEELDTLYEASLDISLDEAA